jgi:hypothetical protein
MRVTAGNCVVTGQFFDAATSRLNEIKVDWSGAITDFSYLYDARGDLKSRAETRTGVSRASTMTNSSTA